MKHFFSIWKVKSIKEHIPAKERTINEKTNKQTTTKFGPVSLTSEFLTSLEPTSQTLICYWCLVAENQSWIEFLKTVWNFKNCFLLAFAIKKPLKQWNLGLIWCRNYYNFFIIFNFCPSLIHYHYLLSLHQSFCTKLQKILTSKNMNLYCVFESFNHYEIRTTIKFSKNLSNSYQIFLNLQ